MLATGAVRYRWAVMGGVAVLAVAAGMVARTFATEFIPQVDEGAVTANVNMGPGTPPAVSNRISLEVEKMVKEMPAVASVFANAGGRGNLDIKLVPSHDRDLTSDQWVQQLQRKVDDRAFPGGRIFVRPPRLRGIRTNVAGADVSVAIVGDELPVLDEVGNEVVRRLRGIPGLENVQMQQQEPNPMFAPRSTAPLRRGTPKATSSTTCACCSRSRASTIRRTCLTSCSSREAAAPIPFFSAMSPRSSQHSARPTFDARTRIAEWR